MFDKDKMRLNRLFISIKIYKQEWLYRRKVEPTVLNKITP